MPKAFPTYPGSAVVGENTYVGTGLPAGASHRCTESLSSGDDAVTVHGFYIAHLGTAPCAIRNDNVADGSIEFALTSVPTSQGRMVLLSHGVHTEIQIEYL